MKNSFILYNDVYESIKDLSIEDKAMLLDAVFDYSIKKETKELTPMCKMAFSFIRCSMDRNDEKWENVRAKRSVAGIKGNRKRWGKSDKIANAISVSQKSQKVANVAVSVPVSVSVSVNVINKYISYFNEKFGSNYQPTKGREAKLKLRLKSFSIEQILTAVDNLYQSPFHRGQNDKGWRADVDFLIRNDEQVDKWLNVNPRASNGVILKSLDDVQVEDIKNNPEKLIIYKKQKYDVSRFVRQD
jgi:hypothetical protein